tara:strand:- start:92 stop:634 length:543 start_codon:yes stop_codon:yes gene_type:complete
MKKAVILTWSGYQDHEVIYPYFRLKGAGYETTLIGDKRDGLGRIYGILGTHMQCDVTYEEFYKNIYDYEEFDLLIIPGGVKALEKLRQEDKILKFIFEWNSKDKVIGSTCHGAQLLISSQVTEGKNISGYYSIKDDINNSGATYVNEPVVVDKNIITSPHYDYMGEWMEKIIEIDSNSSS